VGDVVDLAAHRRAAAERASDGVERVMHTMDADADMRELVVPFLGQVLVTTLAADSDGAVEHSVSLTPSQARELGFALISAAVKAGRDV
jgi:hypothetical protein